jgi:hypothetical protein
MSIRSVGVVSPGVVVRAGVVSILHLVCVVVVDFFDYRGRRSGRRRYGGRLLATGERQPHGCHGEYRKELVRVWLHVVDLFPTAILRSRCGAVPAQFELVAFW